MVENWLRKQYGLVDLVPHIRRKTSMIKDLNSYQRSPYGITERTQMVKEDHVVRMWLLDSPPAGHAPALLVVVGNDGVQGYQEADSSIALHYAIRGSADEILARCKPVWVDEVPWFLLEEGDDGFMSPESS